VRVATGKVISGKVVIEGEPLEEGTTVTILARESDETFDVSEEDEAKLLESLAEAAGGDAVPASRLLLDLGPRS
jgi:hypothetical protein